MRNPPRIHFNFGARLFLTCVPVLSSSSFVNRCFICFPVACLEYRYILSVQVPLERCPEATFNLLQCDTLSISCGDAGDTPVQPLSSGRSVSSSVTFCKSLGSSEWSPGHLLTAGQKLSLVASGGEWEVFLLQQPQRGQTKEKVPLSHQGYWLCPWGEVVQVSLRLRPMPYGCGCI